MLRLDNLVTFCTWRMGWRAGWLVGSLLLLEVVVGSGRLCYSCNQRRPTTSCPLNATVISVKWVCHEIEFNPNWLCCRYKQLNMYINLNMGLNIKKMPSGTVNSISYFILQYLFKWCASHFRRNCFLCVISVRLCLRETLPYLMNSLNFEFFCITILPPCPRGRWQRGYGQQLYWH